MHDLIAPNLHTRILHMMDNRGHTSFGWDVEDDDWVLPMIQRKMDEGYTFWIVERRPMLREVQLMRIQDIGDNRHVFIHDASSRELFEQGHIGLLEDRDDADQGDLHVTRRADNARDAASHDTVAHRHPAGG